MITIEDFIKNFPLSEHKSVTPWSVSSRLSEILIKKIGGLDKNFVVSNGVAIHNTATIEQGAIIKPPAIICAKAFVGSHSYLRGGVYLAESVVIGPGSEIKSSIIASGTTIAHFNFIGDSLIGSDVNFEAGSLTANYNNEKSDKRIYVYYESATIDTGVDKFGSIVGDGCKVGANAVLSPGTLLSPGTIVKRLELIDQFAH